MEEVIGLTFDVLGKVLLGLAVLKVHAKLSKDHKIDCAVIKTIKYEKTITITGIILIILGYLINIKLI